MRRGKGIAMMFSGSKHGAILANGAKLRRAETDLPPSLIYRECRAGAWAIMAARDQVRGQIRGQVRGQRRVRRSGLAKPQQSRLAYWGAYSGAHWP